MLGGEILHYMPRKKKSNTDNASKREIKAVVKEERLEDILSAVATTCVDARR